MIGIIEIIGIGTGAVGIGIIWTTHLYMIKCSKPPSHGNGGHRKYKTVL